MKQQSKSLYEKLRDFAISNKCDAVLLIDGTIKRYMGERFLAIAIYKFSDKKLYELAKEKVIESVNKK